MALDSTTSIQENYTKYAKYFEDSGKSTYTSEMFYKLLLAEMTNQDPMEPTSNSEFVSQMASFTTLQNQTDSLYYQSAAYANSLVGKNVTLAVTTGTDDLKVTTGTVTTVDLSDKENMTVTVDGKQYKLSAVMTVNEDSSSDGSSSGTASSLNNGAYATSLIGKKVTTSVVNSSGATILDSGTVTGIEIKNGVFTAVVNNLGYELSSIVKVENASSTASTDDSK